MQTEIIFYFYFAFYLETLGAYKIVIFRHTSLKLDSLNRKLYVNLINGLNFENPITNEPYSLFFWDTLYISKNVHETHVLWILEINALYRSFVNMQINLIYIQYSAWLSYPGGITISKWFSIGPQNKSAHNGYPDLTIGIMSVLHKSSQLRTLI